MRLEPLLTFSGGEFSHRFSDKSPATSVLSSEEFFILDRCSDITSSSSRKDNFFSWRNIFIEEMDRVFTTMTFEDCRSRHKSSSSCSDDDDVFHRKSILNFISFYNPNSRIISFFVTIFLYTSLIIVSLSC